MTASEFYKYVAERGGVPQSYARQWSELIFTCLREVVISQPKFRLGKICDITHEVRKARICRNPISGEYIHAPDRDYIKIKILPQVIRDFQLGIKDGTVESKAGGYLPSVPLTREECEERGYKTGFFKDSIARMKGMGYDLNSERAKNYFEGQIALANERKEAERKAAENKK